VHGQQAFPHFPPTDAEINLVCFWGCVRLHQTPRIFRTWPLFRFIRYGATLTHLIVPDEHGEPRDIALGWDDTTHCRTQ
jgi:hypothetical protein